MPLSLTPWNWQQTGWPVFSHDEGVLRPLEADFLRCSGVHVGAFSHLGKEDQDSFRADLLSDEALLTSRIRVVDLVVNGYDFALPFYIAILYVCADTYGFTSKNQLDVNREDLNFVMYCGTCEACQ